MPRFDQSSAQALVFTFKDGLLSKIAHDLKLAITRFNVDVEPGSVRAEFDTRSLVVATPMKDGQDNPSALNDGDKAKIQEQIVSDVLHSNEHGTASFVSRSVSQRPDGGYSITGELTLHGVTRTISTETEANGGWQIARIELNQPEFGITPFKAMMGTLKIKPDVIVQLSIPQG
jgi:polyisoprenoid-binding protein YceI